MTLRRAHGRAAELGTLVAVEVSPVDELPAGRPGPARVGSPTDRGEGGKFAPGNRIASDGGKARQGKTRLAERMSLRSLPEGSEFAPYRKSAVSFRRAQCAELARNVGGGVCGPAPSSFVASAALQLAWSRYFSDLAANTGDSAAALTASRLADASRQNLLAAHELCAKEAQARAAGAGLDPIAALGARLDALTPKGGT